MSPMPKNPEIELKKTLLNILQLKSPIEGVLAARYVPFSNNCGTQSARVQRSMAGLDQTVFAVPLFRPRHFGLSRPRDPGP